jgi:hypothetical protein
MTLETIFTTTGLLLLYALLWVAVLFVTVLVMWIWHTHFFSNNACYRWGVFAYLHTKAKRQPLIGSINTVALKDGTQYEFKRTK